MTSEEMRIQKAKELEELKDYVKANHSAAAYKYCFHPPYLDLDNPEDDKWLIDTRKDLGKRGWDEVDEVEAMVIKFHREWNKRIRQAEAEEWEETKKELGNCWFRGGGYNENNTANSGAA